MNIKLDDVICGDAATTLRKLPDEIVDLVVTSPPYFRQRDYGENGKMIGNESSMQEYLNSLIAVAKECERVLRPSGSLIFNIGDKYDSNGSLLLAPYRFAIMVLEKTSLKLINDIEWVKQNPQPRQFKRRLVSSHEPFFHFVKTKNYKYYPERFESENGKKSVGKKPGEKIGEGYYKQIEESNLTEEEKKNARRELSEVISEVRSGKISSFRMKIRGIHSQAYGGYEGGRKMHLEKKGFTIIRMFGETLKRDVMITPKAFNREYNHPAIFPEEVIERLIKLTTDVNDLVIDPFSGSGTSCVAAKRLGRHYLGIDINDEYREMAKRRVDAVPLQSRIELWTSLDITLRM